MKTDLALQERRDPSRIVLNDVRFTAAVALVPVTTVALSAPGTTNGDADGQQLAYVYCEANRADALIGQ